MRIQIPFKFKLVCDVDLCGVCVCAKLISQLEWQPTLESMARMYRFHFQGSCLPSLASFCFWLVTIVLLLLITVLVAQSFSLSLSLTRILQHYWYIVGCNLGYCFNVCECCAFAILELPYCFFSIIHSFIHWVPFFSLGICRVLHTHTHTVIIINGNTVCSHLCRWRSWSDDCDPANQPVARNAMTTTIYLSLFVFFSHSFWWWCGDNRQ